MNEIDEYNAVAMKLLEALEAADSDYIWSYYAWGEEQEKRCSTPWTEEHIEEWKEKWGEDPPTPDELREQELSYIKIRAMTKKRYAKGRLFMDQEISRVLVEDTNIDIVSLLISAANTSAADKLRDE